MTCNQLNLYLQTKKKKKRKEEMKQIPISPFHRESGVICCYFAHFFVSKTNCKNAFLCLRSA